MPPDPSTVTGAAAAAYAARDNCITFQLTEAGPQPQRLALAAVYDGLGAPALATVALYLYDATQTGRWLVLPPPSPTLTLGQVVVADMPVVMSVLAQAWTIALVPSVAAAGPGLYTFEGGLSESGVSGGGGGGGGGSATAANQVTQIGLETATATATSAAAVGTPGAAAPAKAGLVAGQDGGGVERVVKTDTAGDVQVGVVGSVAITAASLPLPTGAATSADQASQVFFRGYGDCDLKARMLVALCLASGVQARIAPVFRGENGFPHVRAEVLRTGGETSDADAWDVADPTIVNSNIGQLPKGRPFTAWPAGQPAAEFAT